jgi:serine/threonine protein phosphatase PrpC
MTLALASKPISPAPGPFRPGPPPQAPLVGEDPPARSAALLAGRYWLDELIDARGGVERFTGVRYGPEPSATVPVVLLREPTPTRPPAGPPAWPGLAWEEDLRRRARHLGLSGVLDRFTAGGHDHLALEGPTGVTLWDVWDDPTYGAFERFGWLAQLADLLRTLHRTGAVVESLRPGQVHISPLGQILLDASVTLLPLPLPAGAPVRPSLVSAPELIAGGPMDARADLYCFGTLLAALELGHELTELDFRAPGDPRPFLERFPDAHPFLGRLLAKTFQPDRALRFPTGEAADDLSGFEELTHALGQAQRLVGRARLDVAAWTTTGMTRGGNEDALAVVRATELREDEAEEYALVLVADGMGGSAAGEVAAALAVESLRRTLLAEPPFRGLAEDPGLPRVPADRAAVRRRVLDALREANRLVYRAAREQPGRRGMGCTAEAVYLDSRQVVVGHVGDSRTYHLSRGRLVQLTRDQTLVGRLVELGQLTPAEAEVHPRRAELRQAIGGRMEVEPELYDAVLAPGDWVVVCTDGLNCLRPAVVQDILERATSAEQAARRLVNRANLDGAADNVSVVVVRAT